MAATVNDTALITACKEGDVDTVTSIIESPDFDWKKSLQWVDKDGNHMDTPAVFVAVDYNQMATVKLLLDADGADINIKDSNDYFPLQLASFNGNMEMVQLLLDRNASVDQDALDLAEEHGHGDVATLLRTKVDLYAGIDDVDDIMIKASRVGDVKKVQELIADGYDFDKWKEEDDSYQEYSPIYVAMKNGHIDVISEFLQAGVEAELHSTHFNHDLITPTVVPEDEGAPGMSHEQIRALMDQADNEDAEAAQEETS